MRRIILGVILFFGCFLSLAFSKEPQTLVPLAKVRLEASFNTAKGLVSGEAKIELPPRKVVWINVKNLALKRVSLAGRVIEPEIEAGAFRVLATSAKQILKISFSGRFQGGENLISKKAIVLTENWFPSVKGLAFYDLHLTLPRRFKAVAPADTIKVIRKKTARYHFVFPHPSEAPPLVAAPFRYYEKRTGGVTLAVYLLKPDPKLARVYLEKASRYLRQYERLLGPYPYRRFAVVENIFPTGYAYPTFTLIGRGIIRFPFITKISLRHELLHNWFGNGVFVDWTQGNWCEGLVTYLADHLTAEEEAKGAHYRHHLLVKYESYVTPQNEFPLKDFRYRKDEASQAIGYGKGALFFHMLERRLGKDLFFQALRDFYQKYLFQAVSWRELRKSFEKVSQSSLETFFKQWIERPGLPRLFLAKERLIPLEGEEFLVGLSLGQTEPYYELTLNIRVVSEKEAKDTLVFLSGPRARVDLKIKGKPIYAALDPDYDLARHLSEPEFPPVLARLFGPQGGKIILFEKQDINIYRPLVTFMEKKGYRLELTPLFPQETVKNLLYLDKVPENLKALFGKMPAGDFCLKVAENPTHPQAVVALAKSTKREITQQVLGRLKHLGRYQTVCISGGKTVLKEEPAYEKGIRVSLERDIRGVSFKDLYPLETIARAVSLHRVIFLGEQHDRYEEHLAQLAIIKWLHENGHQIAIGLEMFQRPFQKVLDDYVAHRIDELSFLKKSQYFKRWGFNYRLYKPIIDYARESGIPLVALNVPSELTDKVAKEGLEALSPEEKADLPEIDRQNQAYREYLRLVYETHPENRKEIKDFETFYQAQLLWDEGMAQSIVRYLSEHPERQMVVLVGRAHVVYGYGIPSRIARRGIDDYVIVLLSAGEGLAPAMADYVLFPPPEKPPFFAKIGILIEETKEGLVIRKVVHGTPGERAGLKAGDVILEADGKRLHDLSDLKLILYQKGREDKIKLVVLREGHKKKISVGPFERKKPSKFHGHR